MKKKKEKRNGKRDGERIQKEGKKEEKEKKGRRGKICTWVRMATGEQNKVEATCWGVNAFPHVNTNILLTYPES